LVDILQKKDRKKMAILSQVRTNTFTNYSFAVPVKINNQELTLIPVYFLNIFWQFVLIFN